MTEAQLLFILAYRLDRAMHAVGKAAACKHLSQEAFDAIHNARTRISEGSQDATGILQLGRSVSGAQRNIGTALSLIPKENEQFEPACTMLKNADLWLDGKHDTFIPVPQVKEVKA